jgi:ABC-type dipeptide/oligopeptide/nickel transport system permease component
MKKLLGSAFDGLITIIVLSALTFFLMKLVPGGPFNGDKALPPEVLRSLEAKFRLDQPWPTQYLGYMKDLIFGWDLGPSIKYPGRTVAEIISESWPASMELGSYALVVAISLGISLGVIAALKRGTWMDLSSMLVAVSGVSLPSFLVAALAILVFSQKLGWMPAALWDSPLHKVMPSLVLGLRPAAIIARFTRSSLLEVLNADYVRTARSKGLSERKVILIHAMRNALLPVLTILGPIAAAVLTGSFVVEHVFSIPGLASHYIQAVSNRDYPLVMGVTLLFGVVLVAINTLVDLSYAWIDPRMKEQ